MGPSGSGKSTLMHCLAGLDSVTVGQVWIGDTELAGAVATRSSPGCAATPSASSSRRSTWCPRSPRWRTSRCRSTSPAASPTRSGSTPSSTPSACATGSATGPASSPAASSSASPAPARWPAGPRSSSPTSPPATSTPAPAPRCSASCAAASTSSARPSSWSPTTPVPRRYADRVLFLADGRIVDEMREPTADAVLERMKAFEAAQGLIAVLRAALRSLLQHKLRLLAHPARRRARRRVRRGHLHLHRLAEEVVRRALPARRSPTSSSQPASAGAPGSGSGGAPAAGDAVPTLPASLVGDGRAPSTASAAAYGHRRGRRRAGASAPTARSSGRPVRRRAARTWVPDPAISPLTLACGEAPRRPRTRWRCSRRRPTAAGVQRRRHGALDTPRRHRVGRGRRPGRRAASRGSDGGDARGLRPADGAGAAARVRTTRSPASRCGPTPGVSQDDARRAGHGGRCRRTPRPRPVQQRSADIAERLETTFQFINTFLLAFAFIALFVAIFLIFNTFSMLVAQRTRELALLRAVGASRGQVRRSVLAEAFVLGRARRGPRRGRRDPGLARGCEVLLKAFGADLPVGPARARAAHDRGLARRRRRRHADLGVRPGPSGRRSCRRWRRCATRSTCRCGRCACAPCVGAVLLLLAVVTARGRARARSTTASAPRSSSGVSALCALRRRHRPRAHGRPRRAPACSGAPFAGCAVGRLARENGRRNPRRTAATASALAIGLALMTAIGVIAASTKASVAVGHRRHHRRRLRRVRREVPAVLPRRLRRRQGHPGRRRRSPSCARCRSQVDGDAVRAHRRRAREVHPGRQLHAPVGQPRTSGSATPSSTTRRPTELGLTVGEKIEGTFVNGTSTLVLRGIYTAAGPYDGYVTTIAHAAARIGSRELDSAVYVRAADGRRPRGACAPSSTASSPAFPTVDAAGPGESQGPDQRPVRPRASGSSTRCSRSR